MSWVKRTSPIQVGDRVAFSKQWLQSTGQLTGDIPFARGTVKELKPLGETILVTVDWNDPNIPQKVNVSNLSQVTEKGVLDRD